MNNNTRKILKKLQKEYRRSNGNFILYIYEEGSQHIDHVDNQYFYGDTYAKPKKTPPKGEKPAVGGFDGNTPLSALFRKAHHEELRKRIEAWRPFLKEDDSAVDTLNIAHFEFDKKRIYSNRVYYDLLDLDDLGALQVPLSQLASYLADHSNLSQSYDTLYRQLKKYRQERP